ncbi:MAG: SRPBCC family protein, partial [Anaerolineae bacterium]|nr:SRPBCC family protein [Anaerolineae bacterium]
MALIDQRILIDAPTHVIWDTVSDPEKLASWHAGYTGVSVLTTEKTGAGTRRRCSLASGGKDVIEEVTHWVDGLGYEYTLVDGSPYRQFQGRIRLQAGPDGTSVQWVITYRPKGLIGLLRDRAGGQRALTAMMADSLRQLRRQIDTLGVRMDADYRERVGMRDRLNAEERAQYQRRHAPRASSDPAILADPALALDLMLEPEPAAPAPEPDTVLPISPAPETAPVPPAA